MGTLTRDTRMRGKEESEPEDECGVDRKIKHVVEMSQIGRSQGSSQARIPEWNYPTALLATKPSGVLCLWENSLQRCKDQRSQRKVKKPRTADLRALSQLMAKTQNEGTGTVWQKQYSAFRKRVRTNPSTQEEK